MKGDKVKQNVELLLRADIQRRDGEWGRRDSATRLMLDYWEKFCGVYLTPNQRRLIEDAPSAETISRRRRELRDQFPPSPKVDKILHDRFREHTATYSQKRMF